MWSYPPSTVNSSMENIAFGMDVMHICENQTDKDALQDQCPIVCFKASTVMQSMGIIASRTILPSSDPQGGKRERTYCPSTFFYGYSYYTPSKYSNTLAQYGGLPMLAHEFVLSVIAQMSNKNTKHPYCAYADAQSTVVSGMLISLTPHYQPKVERFVRLINTIDFRAVEDMVITLNTTLFQVPDFAKVSSINYANMAYYHKSGDYTQYKICPEIEAEELVYAVDQTKSVRSDGSTG